MKTKLTVTLLIFASLLLTPAAGHADVILEDPNTGAANQQIEDASLSDRRLARTVTCQARKKPIATILDDLSKETGIRFYAGQNNQDWQVRDRKMNIFVKDIPCIQLMNSITRITKTAWIKGGTEGNWSYRLVTDNKEMKRIADEAQQKRDKIVKEQTEKREKLFDTLGRLDSISPDELAKLREEQPQLYLFKTTGIGQSLSNLFDSAPEIREALISGEQTVIPVSSLSPQAQQSVLNSMQSITNYRIKASSYPRTPLRDDLPAEIGSVAIHINGALEPWHKLGLRNGNVLAQITFRDSGVWWDGMFFNDPESKFWATYHRGDADIYDGLQTRESYSRLLDYDQMHKYRIQDAEKFNFGEPLTDHSDDPGLKSTIQITKEQNGIPTMPSTLDELQEIVASKSAMGIVSDCWSDRDHFIRPGKSDKMPLQDVFDMTAQEFNYNWWRAGSVIEFRSRDWYNSYLAMVPESQLEEWRTAIKDTGTLTIDQLAAIAALTIEQYESNIAHDALLGRHEISKLMDPYRSILRLYSCLDKEQKAAVFTPHGLDLRTLSTRQMPYALEALMWSPTLISPSGARLICEIKQETGAAAYAFGISAGDDAPWLDWTVPLPKINTFNSGLLIGR